MTSTIQLREYQEDIVTKALFANEGVIVMSTGAGKTIVALELICRLGLTATILVPKTALQQQFYDECVKWWGYTPAVINADTKEVGKVTIATYQSLYDNSELLATLVANTSVLIVDECQSAVTDKNSEIIAAFRPKYLYGLTATPMREDGKTPAIGFYFGEEICNFNLKQLEPRVRVVRTSVEIPVDDYPVMVENQTRNHERNKLIADLASTEAITGRKVLILTKRIEHSELIQELLPKWNTIYKISSEDKERNKTLAELKYNHKDFSIIVGTTALLSVGVDVPSLDTLILACDMKGEVLTTQSAGRILRLFDGKSDPVIYDLWDNKNPIFSHQFRKRKQLYQVKGWELFGI